MIRGKSDEASEQNARQNCNQNEGGDIVEGRPSQPFHAWHAVASNIVGVTRSSADFHGIQFPFRL